ncbi:MAG: substrate-binding domain-containing protein [Verrucomicrobiota bacterium]
MPESTAPPVSRRVLFVTDFYQEEILLGVVDHARHLNWELITNMRFHGMLPSETQADGILVTGYGERVRNWMTRWRGTHSVHLGMSPPDLDLPWVDVDYEEAGRAGARHFLELGHLNFVFYSLVNQPDTVRVRDAFQEELGASGRTAALMDFEAVHGENTLKVPREERLRWLAESLDSLRKPMAVMVDDDRRSLEIVAACDMLGLRIPEDVSILGCENRAVEVSMSRLPLSSVDMNWRLAGRRAAELLDQMMEGRSSARNIRVKPLGVVGRASTATFITEIPEITRVLLHIRENFAQSLRMTDLARMAGMAERHFRSEFKRLVGHSPRTEIHRARLVTATRLLRDTELKLDAIAFESGLGNAKKLCEVFAEDFGMTPTVWRLQSRY